MSLTRDDWVKVVVGFGAVVLSVALHIGVREWYAPEVQYGTGGAYIHPKLGIATVWLKNWGRADAENVMITASLPHPFTHFSTDQATTPFEPSPGGTDNTSITGTIKKLAPGEMVNIYFITESSERWADQKPVVRGVKYDGGLGKTGAPWFRWAVKSLLILAPLGVLFAGLEYWQRGARVAYDDAYSEAVRRGVAAAQEGLSEEQLRARVEQYRRTIPLLRRPSKEYLAKSAQAGFTAARPSVTLDSSSPSPSTRS
jgi:hypothetical protein